MTGFAAAASYLRGVLFIQILTTLLSQVDSSVGGKTGINHPPGKNMIGAFYQPRIVVADMSIALDTLPDREFSAGLAEVINMVTACLAIASFSGLAGTEHGCIVRRRTCRRWNMRCIAPAGTRQR